MRVNITIMARWLPVLLFMLTLSAVSIAESVTENMRTPGQIEASKKRLNTYQSQNQTSLGGLAIKSRETPLNKKNASIISNSHGLNKSANNSQLASFKIKTAPGRLKSMQLPGPKKAEDPHREIKKTSSQIITAPLFIEQRAELTKPQPEPSIKPLKLSEQKQYFLRLQKAYDQEDLTEFQRLYAQLVPGRVTDTSIRNQAHYLAGLLFHSKKLYGQSLQAFEAILVFQNTNPSDQAKALFGKAMTYKQMNIPEQSRLTFEQIQTQFPTSYEASRAEVEMGMLPVTRSIE